MRIDIVPSWCLDPGTGSGVTSCEGHIGVHPLVGSIWVHSLVGNSGVHPLVAFFSFMYNVIFVSLAGPRIGE